MGLLPSLRRRGVVTEWKEHTPGSFVVKLGIYRFAARRAEAQAGAKIEHHQYPPRGRSTDWITLLSCFFASWRFARLNLWGSVIRRTI